MARCLCRVSLFILLPSFMQLDSTTFEFPTLSVLFEENGRHLNLGYGPDNPVLPRPFFLKKKKKKKEKAYKLSQEFFFALNISVYMDVQEERSQVAMGRRPLLEWNSHSLVQLRHYVGLWNVECGLGSNKYLSYDIYVTYESSRVVFRINCPSCFSKNNRQMGQMGVWSDVAL